MNNLIESNIHANKEHVIVDIDNTESRITSLSSKFHTFKIIVVGDSGVGKTCLTYRFCQGRFPRPTEATVGVDFREKSIQIGNELIKLQVWDTAGQERFRRSMVSHYYRNVHAIIYVYDVTRRETFESLVNWIKECSDHIPVHSIPSMLVGNKMDAPVHNIQVHSRVAQCFAEFHCMEFYETSAADDAKVDQIESIFVMLACRLMVLYNSNAPLVERTERQLIELKPTVINRGDNCYCLL